MDRIRETITRSPFSRHGQFWWYTSRLPHIILKRNIAIAYDHQALLAEPEEKEWLGVKSYDWPWWGTAVWSSQGVLIRALSEAWSVTLDEILDETDFFEEDERIEREIGIIDDRPFVYDVGIIRRP